MALRRLGMGFSKTAIGRKIRHTPLSLLESNPCRPANIVARNAGRSLNAPRPSPIMKQDTNVTYQAALSRLIRAASLAVPE
jgi:hypothetical protein